MEDDQRFELAMRRAGNVVLADTMRAKDIPISPGGSTESSSPFQLFQPIREELDIAEWPD